MSDNIYLHEDIEQLGEILGYFDPQVLASYRLQPDKFEIADDYFEGRIRTLSAYFDYLVQESRTDECIEVRFGYRTLRNGDLAVVAWMPDLKRTSKYHLPRWEGFLLKNPEWVEPDKDLRFEMWVSRYILGSWEVEAGPLEQLRDAVKLLNGLTKEAVGVALFKHDNSPALHFPAAENTHSYEDAHRDLYSFLIDGLNKESITQIAVQIGNPLNINSDRTLTALKRVLPALEMSPTFSNVFEKISASRRPASHGVRATAARYPAFDEFASDLRQCVGALNELCAVLQKELNMDAEKAAARNEKKKQLPRIAVPAKPNYAICRADQMVGKIVERVEYGQRQEVEGMHQSEVLIIYFTDGSILGIQTGSDVPPNSHPVAVREILSKKMFCLAKSAGVN